MNNKKDQSNQKNADKGFSKGKALVVVAVFVIVIFAIGVGLDWGAATA